MSPLLLTIAGVVSVLLGATGVAKTVQDSDWWWLAALLPWLCLTVIISPYQLWKQQKERGDRYAESSEPQLVIGEFRGQRGGAFGEGFGWGLRVTNVGTEEAENCLARLEQIASESPSSPALVQLKQLSLDKPLHWSGQLEGMHEFKISGRQTARLNVVYFDHAKEYSPNRITLAYRANRDIRLSDELTTFSEPVLLLLNITSKGKCPQYVVCRVDLEDIPSRSASACTVLWKGIEQRDLSEFQKTS